MPIERTGKVTGWRATGGNTHPFPAVKTWRASEEAGARNRGAAVPRSRPGALQPLDRLLDRPGRVSARIMNYTPDLKGQDHDSPIRDRIPAARPRPSRTCQGLPIVAAIDLPIR